MDWIVQDDISFGRDVTSFMAVEAEHRGKICEQSEQ